MLKVLNNSDRLMMPPGFAGTACVSTHNIPQITSTNRTFWLLFCLLLRLLEQFRFTEELRGRYRVFHMLPAPTHAWSPLLPSPPTRVGPLLQLINLVTYHNHTNSMVYIMGNSYYCTFYGFEPMHT